MHPEIRIFLHLFIEVLEIIARGLGIMLYLGCKSFNIVELALGAQELVEVDACLMTV